LYKRDYGVFKITRQLYSNEIWMLTLEQHFKRSGIYNKTAPEAKGSFKTKREHYIVDVVFRRLQTEISDENTLTT
jgi:hypothetical protein